MVEELNQTIMAARSDMTSNGLGLEMKSCAIITQFLHRTIIMEQNTIINNHPSSKGGMHCSHTYTISRSHGSMCLCCECSYVTISAMFTHTDLGTHFQFYTKITNFFYHNYSIKFKLEKTKSLLSFFQPYYRNNVVNNVNCFNCWIVSSWRNINTDFLNLLCRK